MFSDKLMQKWHLDAWHFSFSVCLMGCLPLIPADGVSCKVHGSDGAAWSDFQILN